MGDLFDESVSFESLGLRDSVLEGIAKAGFEHPTDIQAKLIPAVLSGKDVIGQAKTGTGKTAAFGLPILNMADKDTPMQALILVPTRELAAQLSAEIESLGKCTPIRTTCIVGGESMRQQIKSVEHGGHIMVGTPGRIMDLYDRRQIRFDRIRFVVLDEVDRMLDIGFREDIRKILRNVKSEHQTIFVSATIDAEVERLARSFTKPDAERITTIGGSLTVAMVQQRFLSVERWDKRGLLLYLLRHEKLDTTLVFCRTKETVRKLARYLDQKGISASEIHADLPQSRRNKVMEEMRQGRLGVLVASDLAARGLDIDHITDVINYDLPDDPEVYVHRIGRTARVGRSGVAWSFVSPDQGRLLTEIEKLAGVMIEEKVYPGFKPGRVPEDIRDERDRSDATKQRYEDAARRDQPSATDELSAAELKSMFPDGTIPKTVPTRTIGSRQRTRRRGR
jgi:ATP-dependent RNA helicase DeaD